MTAEPGRAPVPMEQRTVDFYGDDLIAVRDAEGTVWVPVSLLCEALGVARSGQIERIQRDPVLSEALTAYQIQTRGGPQEMGCLPLKYVRAWLFGINANRVKAEVRDRLIQYQQEVIEVIDRHFSAPLAAVPADEAMMTLMRDQALQMAGLWDQMLGEQRRLRAAEAYLADMDDRLSDNERSVRELAARFEALRQQQEALVAQHTDILRVLPAPRDAIGPPEKAAIKALVDDVVAAAQARGIRLGQGRNDYPAVWDALKRRFDVARYDELSMAQFGEAVSWLNRWLHRIRSE